MQTPRDNHLHRNWRRVESFSDNEGSSVSVVSYNILASIHIKPRGYPFCPTGHRETLERHPQLMVEVQHHSDADILCFQEVETDYFHYTLLPDLQNLGYNGIHLPKALGIDEGVATFYQKNRFSVVTQESAHFKDLIAQALEGKQLDSSIYDAVKKHTEYESPLLLTTFCCRLTGRHLVVANVHLIWLTRIVPDVNALQAAITLQRVTDLSPDGTIPSIICGDFNHQPDMPGYQLISQGCLREDSLQHLRKFRIKYSDKDQIKEVCLVDLFPDWFVHNSASIKSAYATTLGKEPAFTVYTDDLGPAWVEAYSREKNLKQYMLSDSASQHYPPHVMDSDLNASLPPPTGIKTLDYIWYTSNTLACLGVEEVVSKELIAPFWACPNQVFPSDHLLMKAKFKFL